MALDRILTAPTRDQRFYRKRRLARGQDSEGPVTWQYTTSAQLPAETVEESSEPFTPQL